MEAFRGDWITSRISTGVPYEHLLLRIVRRLQRPGLFVDVGAHIGNHSVFMGLSGWRVVSFEPNPAAARLLRRNLDANGIRSAVVHGVGVGARAGRASLAQVEAANSGATRLSGLADDGSVEVIALDTLGLAPDVLKIDVEGWEQAVLAGATATIERSRPAIVIESHAGPQAVAAPLRDLGYRVVGGSLASSPTFLCVARPEHRLRSLGWRIRSGASFRRLRDRRA